MWDWLSLTQRTALPGGVRQLLDRVLDTSLQYFLSSRVITASGFPVTALKVSDRARFGYSNPTEWGFAVEAWIVAAERGLITPADAEARIARAIATMRSLEDDPAQFHAGQFYPYYVVVAPDGTDLAVPHHSAYTQLPSGDCALLWASLQVARGWLVDRGLARTAQQVADVQARMSFRAAWFTRADRAYLSMLVDAHDGTRSKYTWFYWADEGGVVAMVSQLAGSTSADEFRQIVATQQREAHAWRGHVTDEAAYFNAMFTWAQRSLLGFPIRGDARARRYAVRSFAPAVAAHLDYGDQLHVDVPAFSDAMTQTDHGRPLVGRWTPPNIEDRAPAAPPAHVTPHALAVPFCIVDVLDERTLHRLFEHLLRLQVDRSGVWHPLGTQDPFGFEVVASPRADVADYAGPDDGRYIFETLSEAYTALSIYDGLQRFRPGTGRTFDFFASRVPGYDAAIARLLAAAYP